MTTHRHDVHTASELHQLTRAQRRLMQKLADRVERFPHRQHRVRLTSKTEIEQPETAPPGCWLLAVTRCIAPGVRERAYIFAREGTGTDADEVAVRMLFEASASPTVWEIEEQAHAELQSWQ